MRKTSLILIAVAAIVSIWLIFKPDQTTITRNALPPPLAGAERQEVLIEPVKMKDSPPMRAKPRFTVSTSSNQTWIAARFAAIEITQDVDGVTDEPTGIIKLGDKIGTLGETPPFYSLQLKTSKLPILLGEKDTRHHNVRIVTSVHTEENELILMPELAVSYPRSASLGGFVFDKHEDQVSRIGIIIPDVIVPEGFDPTSSQWVTSIRIADRAISAEVLEKTVLHSLGQDTVIVLPTEVEPFPAEAQILWLVLDANGSFVVEQD